MKWLTVAGIFCLSSAALSHQPVMDMAPRWSEGYGIQTRVERLDSQTTTWVEGVYTWDRSIRGTFKLPYRSGELGDLILGLPLKKYNNQGARTANWSITPSVQLPTGDQGQWDTGLSISYSAETPTFYQLYDLYSWGDRSGLDINVGFAFPGQGGGIFALWDVSALTTDNGDSIRTGPVFVYFKKNLMFRAEYKQLVFKRDNNNLGNYFSLAVGVVY